MKETNEVIQKSIQSLADMAGREHSSSAAMQYAQAALNLAQVLSINNNIAGAT